MTLSELDINGTVLPMCVCMLCGHIPILISNIHVHFSSVKSESKGLNAECIIGVKMSRAKTAQVEAWMATHFWFMEVISTIDHDRQTLWQTANQMTEI